MYQTVNLKVISALTLIIVFAVLYLLTRNKADDYAVEIKEYEFRMPFLASLGFYLAEKIPYDFRSDFDRKARVKVAQLFGQKEANTYFEVHVAQKLSIIIALSFFLTVVFLVGETDYSFCFFALAILTLVYVWLDKELDKKIKAKKRDILIDLPELINTTALLINAGLPFSQAMQKTVNDSDPDRPLYKELNCLMAELSAGKPVNQAYEDLAQRCRVPEITRFVSMILQNLNRGNSDLVHILRVLSQEAWEKRKDIAKKQGEEASAKLVFPMVLVFVAVSIIVLAPAIIMMNR